MFDFSLSGDEVAAMDAIDRGERGGPDPADVTPLTVPVSRASPFPTSRS